MYSGLSSFIYYPAITAIARSMSVSIEAINLSITSYQIVSGVAPSVLGDMADQVGRRPICLVAFLVYFAANLGLALQNDYAALIALRCLQSAGASSTIAIAYGFIADIAPPVERGSYVGILQGLYVLKIHTLLTERKTRLLINENSTNSAPCIGPVLGGILTETLSWRWVFWFLSILSGCNLIILLLVVPETCRKLVSDGSGQTPHWMYRPLVNILRNVEQKEEVHDAASPRRQQRRRPRINMPNPLHCLKLLLDRASFLVILIGGMQYTVYGCIATSLSTLVIRTHGLNYLKGGLTYLPLGVGGILAALLTGRVLDRDYRRTTTTTKDHIPAIPNNDKFPIDLNLVGDFPIVQARLKSIFPLFGISCAATLDYGWSLHHQVHVHAHAQAHPDVPLAVPLLMTFLSGASQVSIFTICGTLLTDLNPNRSATVQASYSLIRCLLSAGGIAAVEKLIDAVAAGWGFTVFALVVGVVCVPLAVVLRKWGPRWRIEARRDRGASL
ncbi:Quinidine resistance protein 1 [Fonsecaea pedrosoi]|nr:Quinidine resistance protein 1 [Fonsecaea pedrosoi]